MKLISLIIPVYNEEKNIKSLLDLLEKIQWPAEIEYVFVDDKSKDGSVALIERLAQSNPRIRLEKKPENGGKGSAIIRGIEIARGDVLGIQDADLEYDPGDLPKLIQPILNGKADVVYGSRFRRDVNQVHRTFHRMINCFLTFLSNFFSGIFLTDMESCYKVFRADVLKSFELRARRFGFEPEITAYIAKFPLKIQEFPISYFPRSYLEGKKIGWKDGVAALWFIFKFNYLYDQKKCLKKQSHLYQVYIEKSVAPGTPQTSQSKMLLS